MLNQTLKESYEYSLSEEEMLEFKNAVLSKARINFIVGSVLVILSVVLRVLSYPVDIIIGIFAMTDLVFALQYSSVKRVIKAVKPNDSVTKLRFYDDFLVMEVSNSQGIETVTTTRLDKLIVFSKKCKNLVVLHTGVHVLAFKLDLVKEGSFISNLLSPKGLRFKSSPDTPDTFVEDFSEIAKNRPIELNPERGSSDFDKTATENAPTDDSAAATESEKAPFEGEVKASAEESSESGPAPYLFEMFTKPQIPKIYKVLSVVFAIVGAIYIALSVSLIFANEPTAVYYTCGRYLLIAIINVTFGIILLKKHGKGKINVIVAIILALALIIVMLTTPSNTAIGDKEALEGALPSIEAITNVIIENYSDYYVLTDENGNLTSASLYFEGEAAEIIRSRIVSNPRFINEFPTAMIGLMPQFSRYNTQDKALIYNYDSEAYNSNPAFDGSYKMIFVALYDDEYYTELYIDFYELEYSTEAVN